MSYVVKEIFYSLQGEGVRAGTAALFLRFAGCNLKCSFKTHGFDCDTRWDGGKKMSLDEIIDCLAKEGYQRGPLEGCTIQWVVLTGGEPGLQVDADLVDRLHEEDYAVAIETNGTVNLDILKTAFDWITVSPKVPEEEVKQLEAHEVKYVMMDARPLPEPACMADHYLLSPKTYPVIGVSQVALKHCIKLVKENPRWRLSMQQHKIWDIQ